jgi:hypothetical protein
MKYLEDILDVIESVDDATKMTRICHGVIQRMIRQERIIMVVEVF